MGIKISQPFTRTGKFAIDETLLLTKAQMIAINDNLMPEKYFTLCKDDGKFYIYDKERTPSAETGKFVVFEGGSGTNDYNDLINQPTLEGEVIKGDMSLSDFGILSDAEIEELIYSKITDSEGNLIFYTKDETYSKDEVYTKEEVDELIEVLPKFEIKVVDELPTKDISDTTIYLLRNTDSEGNNFFDEYIYVNKRWELIGTTKIDLSDYYTSAEVDVLLDEKQDVLTAGTGIDITGNIISVDDTEVATKDEIDKLTKDLEDLSDLVDSEGNRIDLLEDLINSESDRIDSLIEILDSEGNRIDLLEDLINDESNRIDSLVEIVDSEGNRISILENEIDNLEIPYFVTTTDSEGNSIVNIISGDETSSVSFGSNDNGIIISVKDGDTETSKELVSKEYVDEAVGEEHVELTQAEYDALTPEQKLDGTIYFVTDGEGEGGNVPPGGTTGQVLTKKSDSDGDVEWKDIVLPSDWGVAKSGVISVPISNQQGSFTISISDLDIASVDDYNIITSVVGGTGSGAWGDSTTFVHSRTLSTIGGSVNTLQGDIQNVLVSYVIVAKGFGTVAGSGDSSVQMTADNSRKEVAISDDNGNKLAVALGDNGKVKLHTESPMLFGVDKYLQEEAVVFNIGTVYALDDFYDVINNHKAAYIIGLDSIETVLYTEAYMDGVVLYTTNGWSIKTYHWASDGSGDYKLESGQTRSIAFSDTIFNTYRLGPSYKYNFNDVYNETINLSRVVYIKNSQGNKILISSTRHEGTLGTANSAIVCYGTDGNTIYTFRMTQNLDPEDNTSYFTETKRDANVLTAPNGDMFRIKVANDGTLSTEAVV